MSTHFWNHESEQEIFRLVERLDTRGPRYTSYPTVPVWKSQPNPEAYRAALAQTVSAGKPIAVYLHLPFCKSRCLYCGCNSYITHDEARICKYADALIAEIDLVSQALGSTVQHAQLHLGGGTPTYVPHEKLEQILTRVLATFPPSADAENSIEVDPRVTTDAHLELLARLGFRRISAGLQDLNPEVQRAIRREFSFEQMKEFVTRARSAGFTSVNVDLIYGLPLQTRASWSATLERVADLQPDRLACFGYAHLPEKIKHQQALHAEDLPSSRERLSMLLDANRYFVQLGYVAIGMDHFSLPDDDLSIAAKSGKLWRNFMGYTTIRGLELLGLGCSGISEFTGLFSQNITPPDLYAEAVLSGRLPIERGHELDFADRIVKQIINHLMCNLEIEIPIEAYAASPEFVEGLEAAMDALDEYVSANLLERTPRGFRVTALGQLFVRNLAMVFDRYLPAQKHVTFSRTV